MKATLSPHHNIIAFASTDDTRPAITGLHITPTHVEATNGCQAIRVPLDATGDPLFIPSESASAAFKAAGRQQWNLTPAGDEHTAETASCSVKLAKSDQRFPNLSQVWPTAEPKFFLGLSATQLEIICAYVRKHGPDGPKGTNAIRFEFTDELSPVQWTATIGPSKETARGILMPCRLA